MKRKRRYIVCVPFFSLPEFPKECKIVKEHNLILRDILLCNKNNKPHFDNGEQYDPHIESNPPRYKYCELPERRKISEIADKYDDVFLLFRTNYLRMDKSNQHYIIGYYKIKKDFSQTSEINKKVGPILYANDLKLFPIEHCINISQTLKKHNLYRVRISTDNTKFRRTVERWWQNISKKEKKDKTKKYIQETKKLNKCFKKFEFKKRYLPCENCRYKCNKKCPLQRRIEKWKFVSERKQGCSPIRKEDKIRYIKGKISSCRNCNLYKTAKQPVPGDWNINAKVMFVGIAPGRLGADRTGVPFTKDKSGMFLRKMLKKSGLPQKDVNITNLVRCNPKDEWGNNRNPYPEEIKICSKYLNEEINLINPLVVVPLGKIPTEYLLGKEIDSMKRYHGKEIYKDNRIICPLYHPSYLVNYPGYDKGKYERDFRKIKNMIKAKK